MSLLQQRGGSKSNFFDLPSNTPYSGRNVELQAEAAEYSPRRLTTVQNARGHNPRGSPHPYRAHRGDAGGGSRSRCHTPDDLLNSAHAAAVPAVSAVATAAPIGSSVSVYGRPQSIHDVPQASGSG